MTPSSPLFPISTAVALKYCCLSPTSWCDPATTCSLLWSRHVLLKVRAGGCAATPGWFQWFWKKTISLLGKKKDPAWRHSSPHIFCLLSFPAHRNRLVTWISLAFHWSWTATVRPQPGDSCLNSISEHMERFEMQKITWRMNVQE